MCAGTTGRCSDPTMLTELRKGTATLLGADIVLVDRWLPSAVNLADGPPRRFSHMPIRRLVRSASTRSPASDASRQARPVGLKSVGEYGATLCRSGAGARASPGAQSIAIARRGYAQPQPVPFRDHQRPKIDFTAEATGPDNLSPDIRCQAISQSTRLGRLRETGRSATSLTRPLIVTGKVSPPGLARQGLQSRKLTRASEVRVPRFSNTLIC